MGQGKPRADRLDALVGNMFSDVFDEHERGQLHERISAWENANPGCSSAERVTAWIDIAYDLHAGLQPAMDTSAPRAVGRNVRLQFP